jgi:hypothetical protein
MFMKARIVLLCATLVAVGSQAATTINPVNKFAYGANIGWLNWQGDGANGAVIGAFACSGNVWGANVGWINLGSGAPANGVRYQNNNAVDFGVNHDGVGNLTGHAWGANIGWLTFTNRTDSGTPYDGPRVDLVTGKLSGFVWSANCGWISLSNQFAFVQTDSINYGPDTDGDGLPDAWELQHAPNLGVLNGSGDNDGDGLSNAEEFVADTDPLDPNSNLRITSIVKLDGSQPMTLTWLSRPTRQYLIRSNPNVIDPQPWAEIGIGLVTPDPGTSTTRDVTPVPDPTQFYVIEAVTPLGP